MMQFLSIFLILTALAFGLSDVTDTQDGAKEIYYDISKGESVQIDNSVWHIGFKVESKSGAVISNKNVSVYESLKLNIDDFGKPLEESYVKNKNNFEQVYNSNYTWEIGAFNRNQNSEDEQDFGWGINSSNDEVVGNKLFAIDIRENNRKTLKQVAIRNMSNGVVQFSICNLDGSENKSLSVNKSEYSDKLFIYFNVIDEEFIAPTPNRDDWHIVFREYKEQIPNGDNFLTYNVIGALTNENIRIAVQDREIQEMPAREDYSLKNNVMGYDWKTPNEDFSAYIIEPLEYFLQIVNIDNEGNEEETGPIYSLVFTNYQGFGKDIIDFDLNAITTSVNNVNNKLAIHPNIASPNSEISLIHDIQGKIEVTIMDLYGRSQISESIIGDGAFTDYTIKLSNLASGVYFLNVEHNGSVQSLKLIIK